MEEQFTDFEDEIYKYIPRPIPLVAKNKYTDDTAISHQPLLPIPVSFTQSSSVSYMTPIHDQINEPALAQSLLEYFENKQIVYKRNPKSLSFKPELLNLSRFISNDRPSTKKQEEIKPFYTLLANDDRTLLFESRFESGNLWQAYKISDSEYDLLMQNDINTKGNTQWFYFQVSNTSKGLSVKFNLINFCKSGSLYNSGMKVMIKSDKSDLGWQRGGEKISYYNNGINRNKKGKCYYSMTFTYEFEHSEDTVYFAYACPYTFTHMMEYLQSIEEDSFRKNTLTRRLLTYSIGGNRCDYLTITAQSSHEEVIRRKGVVISARVHPGETVGSWMMHGVIDFLTGNSLEAALLRENFVFKIIPMLNPDGVINGNYRCNLAGVDLNRRWKDPLRSLHPTIFYAKKLIKGFSRERDLELICDLHGHSRKPNIFMYGCNIPDDPKVTRTYPYILSKISKAFYYKYCSFKMQKDKESTMRIAMFKETRVPHIYTLESSFSGCNFGELQGVHLKNDDLMDMGKQLCMALIINNNLQVNTSITQIYSKNEAVNDMVNDPSLVQDETGSSGSDSEPSEDNLDTAVIAKLLIPSRLKKSKIKERSPQPKQDQKPLKELVKCLPVKKCINCGESEETAHVCIKNKNATKAVIVSQIKPIRGRDYSMKRGSMFNVTSAYFPELGVHLNHEGKKVRDQSTQTTAIPRKVESVGTALFFLEAKEGKKHIKSPATERVNERKSEVEERGRFNSNQLPFITKGKILNIEKIINK